jgi:hypothetical protein
MPVTVACDPLGAANTRPVPAANSDTSIIMTNAVNVTVVLSPVNLTLISLDLLS